ncbi:MAG: helix-hairpin-helix domain-containing protein [Bacteroidales bacterium]|nr:MAG: helix-hairpin-helix domain-containing protein [Bacteroidales bacterium]
MRYPLKIGFFIAFLIAFQDGRSQSNQIDPQQLISEIIEELSSKSENDVDFTPIIEDLIYLLDNPLNLNQCSIDDLSRLVFLSDFQVKGLWDYVQEKGPILSIYELQTVYGIEKEDVERIAPFIVLAKPVDEDNLKNLLAKGNHEIVSRTGTILENQKGYNGSTDPDKLRYLGSKYSLSARYRFQSKDKLEWGLNVEKDAGEQFCKGSNPRGFDYFSGYFAIGNTRRIRKLIIGDFNAAFGQGLTFWSSLSMGKSSDPFGIRKRGRGLVKHSSANENTFLRGAGVTIPIKRVDLTVFGSYKMVDAALGDSLIAGERYFTSLPSSGLHRTSNEVDGKHLLGEFVAGGNIMYKGRKLNAGLSLSHVRIDGRFIPDSTLYNQYEPSMNGRTNVGLNIEGFVRNHHIFGETAIIPQSSERAILVGGLFKLSSLVELSVLGRTYSRGYTNSYTSAFAEGSGSNNESGFFAGISILPVKGLKLSGYVDVFSFSWLRYRVNAPSTGYEYLLQTDYRFSQSFVGQIRYRVKDSEQNFTSEFNRVDIVIPQKSQTARLQFTYTPYKQIMLRSRVDFSEFGNDSTKNEFGFVLSQDIGYTHLKYPFSVSFRFAIFDTDSWNTRIYSYESDMLYTFSVPAYYSKGTRVYLMLKYSPTNRIDCWVRWSQTHYSALKEIGQGLDLIDGNRKSDARIMVRVRF